MDDKDIDMSNIQAYLDSSRGGNPSEAKMSKKEEYFLRKEQQMRKAASQLSYTQLLEKEKLKIESQRQKMLN